MEDKFLEFMITKSKEELQCKDMKLPIITIEQLEDNLDMQAADDLDYIMLFRNGIITKLQLIDMLSGACDFFESEEKAEMEERKKKGIFF